MKFLHVADAHLDSPFGGLSFLPKDKYQNILESTKVAFTRMIDYAISSEVEFVLLVGDTFDTSRPTPATQLFLLQEIARLSEKKIHTYLLFGNHDYLVPESLLLRSSEYVHLYPEETTTMHFTSKKGTVVDLVGFSYTKKHILEDLVKGYPAKVPGHYTIGLLHASQKGSSSEQNNYAPFSLHELKTLNYDYFALGHIHLRQMLSNSPLVVYSGNLQGRHVNEEGIKGFYEVEVTDDFTTKLKFVSTSSYVWRRVKIQVGQALTKDELLATLVTKIADSLRTEKILNTSNLLTIVIQDAENLTNDQNELLADKATFAFLTEQLKSDDIVVRIEYELTKKITITSLDQQFLDQAMEEVLTASEVNEVAKPLLTHQFIADYLESKSVQNELFERVKLALAAELKGE